MVNFNITLTLSWCFGIPLHRKKSFAELGALVYLRDGDETLVRLKWLKIKGQSIRKKGILQKITVGSASGILWVFAEYWATYA